MEKILKKRAVRGILALFCCALWGSGYPCVKIGYEWMRIDTMGGEFLFAGYRFFWAGILTFVVGCFMEKKILKVEKEAIFNVFWLGILQTAIPYLTLYVSMTYLEGSKGSVINSAYVFVSIIAAHFMMKNEKITSRKFIGCFIGFLGIVVINFEPGGWGSEMTFMGEGLMFLGAVAYGVSLVVVRKFSRKISVMTMTSYQMTFAGATLVIIGYIIHGSLTVDSVRSVILYLYMIVLSTASFSVWTVLLKYNEVDKVSIFGFSTPIFGVVLSGLILGEEIFSFKNLIALFLVCFGIIFVNRKVKEKSKLLCVEN